MIYTSGTTGKPKGALRRRRRPGSSGGDAAGHRLHARRRLHHDRAAVSLRTGRVHGRRQALGQTVVLQRRFDPEDWLRLVETYQVTSTFSAPTPIRMICTLPADVKARYDRSSMRT